MRRVVVMLLLCACAHAAKEETVKRESAWSLIDVRDGSANRYHFVAGASGKVEFEYVPVRPEESSSGTYSGGAPRRETLDAGDVRLAALWSELQKLEADPSKQQPERAKGTVAVGWAEAGGAKHDFIVKMGAEARAFVELLKKFGVAQ
ncbi:MAG: hypothetical protein JNK82_39020 [Myxococcaceae bacterium]|nr:hypothetical protein [Myxococcaceae bacterium]